MAQGQKFADASTPATAQRSQARYLTATEVTDILGISPATLYAYVSRGLIRSEVSRHDSRAHVYHAEDVYQLQERKEMRKNPARAAQKALHWGAPLLESALTLLTDGRVYYRGYSATQLALTHTVEEVAALLWTNDPGDATVLFALPASAQTLIQHVLRQLKRFDSHDSRLRLIDRLHVALILAGAEDLNVRPDAIASTGARIVRLLTSVLTTADECETPIAQALSTLWCSEQPLATRLLNAALILCADHELNASTFAARVAASAAAHPYGVVTAGLATLQGARHGGQTSSAEAFMREIINQMQAPDDLQVVLAVLTERLQRGERIPGFGHRLYPTSDPRAQALFTLLQDYATAMPDNPAPTTVMAVCNTIHQVLEEVPTLDWALAALVHALQLPRGAGLALFALGRTIGLIGHAIEQYHDGKLIRPRATYTGLPPRETEANR
jgi:citrate synthase